MQVFALLLAAALLRPEYRHDYPTMDEIRCLSASASRIYVAVPLGVYVIDRSSYRYIAAVTSADGLEGEARLCAFDPARNELLITCDERLYSYSGATGILTRLSPPFKDVRSIGVTLDGAWFETESGFWIKQRVADEYRQGTPPAGVTWFGNLDTLEPRDYSFLNPWFFTDNQLITYQMTLVRPDAQGRRLLVATDRGGILVYDMRSGAVEARIRLGPSGPRVRSIQAIDGRLWFLGGDMATETDSGSGWQYYLTSAGLSLPTGSSLLNRSLLNLGLREATRAFLSDSGRLLVGTDRGLYALGPDGRLVSVVNLSIPVNALFRRDGRLVMGTDDGLFIVEPESIARVEDPYFRSDWGVFSSGRTSDGRIWLGTLGGVLALDSTDTWQHVIPPGFDLSRPVRAMAAAGSLLCFSNGAGLTVYDTRTNSWAALDATTGLASDDVNALYADSSSLWVAARGIITRIDIKGLR